jgi:hypothetical protein
MRRVAVGLVLLLALGLGLRSFHYLRKPSVWHDEAALILNVMERDCLGLLGPLRFHEAAPPLFLWLERAIFRIGGDGEYVLRLPAFLAGCLALIALVPVARRILPAQGAGWAVLFFAISEQLIWHGCEAKPYALDVLVAVGLLGLWVWGRERPVGLSLILAGLAPVLIWLSYPACFLFGGLLVGLLPAARARGRVVWLTYGLLVVAIGGAFLALLLGPVRWQHDAEIARCWTDNFPEWQRPASVPLWLVCSTAEVGRYCLKPLGQGFVVLAAIGAALLWRKGQRRDVAVLVVPIVLALTAACLHRYPYGGSRVMVYAAPALVILSAAAIPAVLAWSTRQGRLVRPVVIAFLLIPLGATLLRFVCPWPVADTAGAAAYVEAHRRPGDTVHGNDWTHLYYFRHVSDFRWCEQDRSPWGPRLWVVFTSSEPAEQRLQTAQEVEPAWHLVERRHFANTTVALLEPGEKITEGIVAVAPTGPDNRGSDSR